MVTLVASHSVASCGRLATLLLAAEHVLLPDGLLSSDRLLSPLLVPDHAAAPGVSFPKNDMYSTPASVGVSSATLSL